VSRWPLRVVLDLAAREEAAARRAFAAALSAEARRVDEREAAAAELRAHAVLEGEASRAGPLGAVGAVGSAGSLRAAAFHLARLRQEGARLAHVLCARDATLAETRKELEGRRDALAAARGAVRALERHREIWREAQARRNARAEESAADEIVSARRRAGS